MRLITFLLSCFCLFTAITTKAETFTVVNNNNGGAGSLRQALLDAAANGEVEPDYIQFNLADQTETGRTIAVLTALPDLTSNLTIDGSTQPGLVFGLSTAKVAVNFDMPGTLKWGLKMTEKENIAIYGMFLKTNIDPATLGDTFDLYGIYVEGGRNITIGAAAKGNVISGFIYALKVNSELLSYSSTNVTIKGNFMGIGPDGNTGTSPKKLSVSLHEVFGTIEIGGTSQEGNLLASGLNLHYATNTPSNALIKNNKIGVNISGSVAMDNVDGISISCSQNVAYCTVNIEDNVINCNGGYAVSALGQSAPITILRNFIGTDRTRTYTLPTYGMFFYHCERVRVGSNDVSDANYVTNCNPVSIWPNTHALINKNSFYCTRDKMPMHFGPSPYLRPEVKIRDITSGSVSGIATPNTKIELFYSDACGTCSPETFFAETIADASGNWQYNGLIGGTVIASASTSTMTSDFTVTEVDISRGKIIGACNGKGSIIGVVGNSATTISWLDEHGNLVGTEPDLIDVPIGKYKMVISNGTCDAESGYLEIKNAFELVTSEVQVLNATCNNGNGSITGISVENHETGDLLYRWRDKQGNEHGTAIELINAFPGEYTLTVTSVSGFCTKTFGPLVVKNESGPNIDLTSMVILDAECGKSNGAIRNLKILNGSTPWRLTWLGIPAGPVETLYDPVTQSYSLLNMKAGIYRVEVSDDSGCPALISDPIEIKEINGVSMNEQPAIIQSADCHGQNGGVSGIVVTGATNFTWRNGNGVIVGNSKDLANVPEGKYYLKASRDVCEVASREFDIVRSISTKSYASTKVIVPPTCGSSNGKIEVIFTVDIPTAVRWQNKKGETIGHSAILENLLSGDYDCYITNDLGCEIYTQKYTVPTGSSSLTKPVINNLNVCSAGSVILNVLQPTAGTYILIDDIGRQVSQSTNGQFNIVIEKTTSFIVVQRTAECESEAANVEVTIENEGISSPPNAFSPNGDGNNDTWQVSGLLAYPNAAVSIFNRNGQKIFSSLGYQKPFDGRWHGADLPIGTYYYIIDLKRNCGTLKGSVTLIR